MEDIHRFNKVSDGVVGSKIVKALHQGERGSQSLILFLKQ